MTKIIAMENGAEYFYIGLVVSRKTSELNNRAGYRNNSWRIHCFPWIHAVAQYLDEGGVVATLQSPRVLHHPVQ